MKKSMFIILSIGVITLSVGSVFCLSGKPEIVSPGSTTRVSVIESRCPAFSWAAEDGASAYELVLYRVPEGVDVAEYQPSDDDEALYTRLPGGAGTWTPSSSQCLQRSEIYLWFIRALKENDEGRAEALSDWSEGSWFMVSPGPSPEEIRRALDMLQGDVFEDSHFPENPLREKPSPFSGNTRAENHYKTQSMSDRSASTAPAAIRGEYSEVSGEGYGVVGATASSSGAGVAAIHLDGGPDLLLDGAEEGNPDTLLYEWGMYRSSGGSTGFSFRNPGHGSFVLDVEGEISADSMTCPSCVGSAELASSSVTSSKIAAGAVGTSQIGTGAVMSDNIAPYSVTTSKIADHAVSSSKLASSSVTSVKIADGTITADDIDPNAAIYTSGSTLYTVTSTTTISGGDDTGLAAAFCSDSNDLPLMGYCQVESVWMRIWGQEPSHWDNSGYQSGFVCNATNEGSGSHDLVAAIICITVIEN